jgi:hypothetical protein
MTCLKSNQIHGKLQSPLWNSAPIRLYQHFLTGKPRANYQDFRLSGHILRAKVEFSLDNIFHLLSIGFLFLTIDIFSGVVWPNKAWRLYWNWNPKETWTFITWIIFVIIYSPYYTHNQGKKTSILLNFNKNNIRYIRVWLLFYDKKDINNDDRNIFGLKNKYEIIYLYTPIYIFFIPR